MLGIAQSQQKLTLIDSEHAFYHSSLSDLKKVELRIQYELTRYTSGPLNSFFQNIAVIYPRLSLNQMEKLRLSFGSIDGDFFRCTDFIRLLNAVASPLFNTTKNKRTVAEAQAAAIKAKAAADDAQAAAEAEATDESKAASHNAKVFAEYMAAKANVGKSAAAKAAYFKSMADKAKAAADDAQATAEAKATDESKAVAKSMFGIFWKADEDFRDATRKAEAIVKANAKAQQGNTQIMMYSDEFDGKTFLKKTFSGRVYMVECYKVYTCKYNPSDLELADAILNVAIFILQVLLPPVSVYDEERYKQHLHDIGICDKRSVDELEYDRRRYIDELRNLSNRIKTFFRNGMINNMSVPSKPKAFHQDVVNCLKENQAFMKFLWNTCDNCQKTVDHLGLWRTEVRCTECGGECPIFQEPTHSDPAQASDHLQALATKLIDATISFGERAHQIATVLLENGVSQLSELLVLNQSEFESLVQKLQLNTLQVQKLRVASGRP
jgi:hypothetical protein